jgi:hypothetical protein
MGLPPCLCAAARRQVGTRGRGKCFKKCIFNNEESTWGKMKDNKMIDAAVLCEKIRALYPDIGECGIDVKAEYDGEQKAWVVHLKKDSYGLKTFLDDGDAEKCLLGEKCVGLSIGVAQLKGNIERMPKDR